VLRALLDANVYASALVKPGGHPGRILHLLVADRAFEVILSSQILVELRRCLNYPKLRKHIFLTDLEIDQWILALELVADMVAPTREIRAVTDDPDDDHLLAAALEGRAAFLVTGDRHVLTLGEYQGIRIVTPGGFWKLLGEE